MKSFKIIDCSISVLLIFIFLLMQCWKQMDALILSYYVVGGWQVISMLVHAYNKWFRSRTRIFYHCLSFIAIITMPMGSVWILYVLAPFMALFYTGLCIYETKIMSVRPISVIR